MSLIETSFGFASTVADVAAGIDLTGRRAVVTGAPSGLGLETARALAATGAEITLPVRDRAETVERRSATLHGVARYALDPDNAQRLWTLSETLLAAA
ncbi:hypothetical protein GCM10023322_32980 [Rugosimonospora acidiphila]|uniref:Short chain dehydrogenase n=1 Tax=Rugosimonospora acidiphila TaxID=556531 RepID=A0ABP9RU09_9ACTN